jgi:hypothetical protein
LLVANVGSRLEEWRDDGRFVCVQVADPDGYRVEVYAHYQRHDVEKRRPAPLTR